MGKILNVSPRRQEYDHSCWAACIRMVLAYDNLYITNDATLARKCGVKVNECQDAAHVMAHCKIFDATDDVANVPTFEEIKEEIDKGRPIIECVSSAYVQPGESSANGHYILIIGYETRPDRIVVIDPLDGAIQYCQYDSHSIFLHACHQMYFAQPYYTHKGRPF